MAANIPLIPVKENHQLVVAPTARNTFYQLPVKNPCGDLLADNRRKDYLEICIPLYEASMTGNWPHAKTILEEHPEVIRSSITENYETALHVASSAKNTHFVENLVKMMTKEDLELQNKNLNTALSLAAAAGTVDIAKLMVERNKGLLTIPGSQGMMPLYMAALFGNSEMVKYLYSKSQKLHDDGWTQQNRGWLLVKCVESDLFDVALDILKDYPELGDDGQVLQVLARKPDAFTRKDPKFIRRFYHKICGVLGRTIGRAEKKSHAVEIVRFIWQRIVQKSKSQIDDIIRGPRTRIGNRDVYNSRMLFVAAEMGNTVFIIELIRLYPDLIWKVNNDNQSIFHVAVIHRHESIYNLLYELGSMKDLITPLKDQFENNMLHLVGKVAKKKRLDIVSGVALQMQRELLWFKEVEQMIPPTYRERKNKEGLTPYELFTKEHKDLVNQGEKWMKGTANQCMVVAALIATIVFAAAFTVPGGYDQTYGPPLYLKKGAFIAFAISDAISLFASSASIIMFLSILTSRYAEHDFLESIPKKLMTGLATLFLSITTMMIAFSVSFFILYHNNLRWVPFLISLFATMPVILFAMLQYPLLADVFRSTYASRYLFKPKKRSLYVRQIWTIADQNRTGYLGRQEFFNYLKLVTVAQSKRDLTPDIVKAALYGPASSKIPAPQINLSALPAGPAPPQMGSTPIRAPSPQGYPPQQSQTMRPPQSTLPTTTFPSQHGGMMLAPSGSSLSAPPRPQGPGPTNLLQNPAPKPNGTNLSASGNGFVSSSAFGPPSQAKNNPVVTVSPPSIPVSGGTQLPNKPAQLLQGNVPHQNHQMQPSFRPNQQVPVQNSSSFSNQPSQPWPKMSQSSVQKYTKVFMEVDTDRDGKISGDQARNLFLSWKLPREILKQVWDLSDQDDDSMLSLKEFCIALYLMERFREGRPLPKVLPPTIFEGSTLPPSGQPQPQPPAATYGAPLWRPPPGVQQAHGMVGPRQVTGGAPRPPRPVPVPVTENDEDMQPRQRKPTVPILEKHLVDQLSTEEQKSLSSKFQEATEADKKVGELEKEILEAKQKIEFYRNKMQEIVLYKSRCDSRLNEITERVSSDKKEVESLSKKYEDKYKQSGDVASKLSIEEATFRDIQEKKMELYRAIVKLDQDGKPEEIQARADRIQADLEEQVKMLNERCKMYGLRGKPTSLVELPFGWQPGFQEGAADWDESWDKFEEEGFTFVKELTLDVENVIAPPKPKSLPVQNKSTFQFQDNNTSSSALEANDNKPKKLTVSVEENNNESNEQKEKEKEKEKKDTSSPETPKSPPKIFHDGKTTSEDGSPHAVKTHSENLDTQSVVSSEKGFDEPGSGWGFDTHYDSDASAAWDLNAATTKPNKDTDQGSKYENSFFDSDSWGGLNPIRTEIPKKSTFTFDSVPGTPAYSYAGSPPADNLFQNRAPFSSSFPDSVPGTPAYSFAGSPRSHSNFNSNQPFASVFADSVPSTPMYTNSPRRYSDGPEDNSFSNNFSRFDSFSSNAPHDLARDPFSRFDSFRSTAQDSEYDQGFNEQQTTLSRFDSMRSSADSDFGHSLFQTRESESFSRFDSMQSRNGNANGNESSDFGHGFPAFDDGDPFGSGDPFRSHHDPFKSETPRRDSVDGWKAF